ncbi:MAG: phosphotransferase [Verrucomicrobia bacterium]|nr:MAG: phosphotransferase [Verrucomicrobiota bacterium]
MEDGGRMLDAGWWMVDGGCWLLSPTMCQTSIRKMPMRGR